MPVYYNPGPQQQAMHEQDRMDNWIRQMIQLFMMKQQRGREDKRWEQEQELSERRTAAYESQAETQRKIAERPKITKPTAQEQRWAAIDGLVKSGKLTQEQGDRLKVGAGKTPEEMATDAAARREPKDPDKEYKLKYTDIIKTYSRKRADTKRSFEQDKATDLRMSLPGLAGGASGVFEDAEKKAFVSLERERVGEIVELNKTYNQPLTRNLPAELIKEIKAHPEEDINSILDDWVQYQISK